LIHPNGIKNQELMQLTKKVSQDENEKIYIGNIKDKDNNID